MNPWVYGLRSSCWRSCQRCWFFSRALGPFATPETPETVFETHYDNGDWMTVEIVEGRRVTKEYRGEPSSSMVNW
jgi:hypothetical protein